MRATRSGIVIGLVLALLVPAGVVAQEASPSAGPATQPEVECVPPPPPAEGTVAAELEARAATLDEQVAATLDTLESAGDSSEANAAIEELAGQVKGFGRQVAGRLELPDGAAAAAAALHRATTSDADDLLAMASSSAASADAPEFTLPATTAALARLREALGLPAPCPTADAIGTRAAATASSDAGARKSIDDLLATDIAPQEQKAIRIAIESAYASSATAETAGEWSRERVLEVIADTRCPQKLACVDLVAPLYAIYLETGDPLFFDAAAMIWASTLNGTEDGEAYAAELQESFSGT